MEKEMYVLASILDTDSDLQIKGIWNSLEMECGLSGIMLTPIPHLSWQGAECYNFVKLEKIINNFTLIHQSISIKTGGLGVFTGINPILFSLVVKNLDLLILHNKLWNRTQKVGECLYQYYSPEEWVPHITLAARDITPEKISCAIKGLINQNNIINMSINNLALLYVRNGEVGIKFKYEFAKAN